MIQTLENKTNAFDMSKKSPMEKHTIYQAGNLISNEESENESSCIQLPPIKVSKFNGPNASNGKFKQVPQKSEYSQHGFIKKVKKSKKIGEDLIKVDKATLFKKAFAENKAKHGKY